MTADILKLILSHHYLSPSQLAMLVFDECHAAVGDGPMNVVRNRSGVVTLAYSGDFHYPPSTFVP